MHVLVHLLEEILCSLGTSHVLLWNIETVFLLLNTKKWKNFPRVFFLGSKEFIRGQLSKNLLLGQEINDKFKYTINLKYKLWLVTQTTT